MSRHLFAPVVFLLASTPFLALAAAPAKQAVAPPDEWRTKRLESLKRETGWLSLVGLHWLAPGETAFGSAKAHAVRLDAPGIPADAGTFVVDAKTVKLRPRPGTALTKDGKPVTGEVVVRPDVDTFRIGRIAFQVIERSDRFAVRVRDPEAPTRVHFKGLDYFPDDPAWRIEATYVPFDKAREIEVGTAIGTTEISRSYGQLKFSIGGREVTLLPFQDDPGSGLFIVFSDRTAGLETYGAGRFLDAKPPVDGKVILDFNHAYNPPCAFTPFATCPLAPRENKLPVEIRAGEKKYAGGHH